MELPLELDWTMDCPSATSSGSNSFSGSSLGEPLTPTSRRSSPQNFDQLFAPPLDGVDVLGFNFTSPAPAGWGYMDVNAAQLCAYDGLPTTPGHGPVDRSIPLTPSCQYPITPSRVMTPSRALPSAIPVTPCQTPSFYSFGDSFTSGPSPISSLGPRTPSSSMPSVPTSFYDCNDASLVWSDCQVDNMFLEEPSPLRINTNVSFPKQAPSARAKASQEARRRTKVLHRAQAVSGPATKSAKPARTARSTKSTKERGKRAPRPAKTDKGRFKCLVETCKLTYARKEHMHRHWNEKHNPHHVFVDCWEPTCGKTFGRQDNLKPHLALHSNKTDRPQARVKQSPIAATQLEYLETIIQKRRPKKVVVNQETDVDETGPEAINRLHLLFENENNILRSLNSCKTSTAPFKTEMGQAIEHGSDPFNVDFLD